ncbi:MAG: BtpA/SgcQ family protein [archaeon]
MSIDFDKIPIFGMIHLAGSNPVNRALEELEIFEDEGVDGAIIENYHGSIGEVILALEQTSKQNYDVVIGINILPNEYGLSLRLAQQFDGKFIQLDYVAGDYTSGKLDFESYSDQRDSFPEIIVLGGVWPKYYTPVNGSILENDLRTGVQRAEAIVVTGSGTGKETPFNKIKKFREIIGDHPLVIGAGLNLDNAYEQLSISNGAIVGTSLKENDNTLNLIDREKVHDFMSVVKDVRKNNF